MVFQFVKKDLMDMINCIEIFLKVQSPHPNYLIDSVKLIDAAKFTDDLHINQNEDHTRLYVVQVKAADLGGAVESNCPPPPFMMKNDLAPHFSQEGRPLS